MCKHIVFQKLARLHGVKQEVLAQLLWQVGLDDFVHLLLTWCPLGGRGCCAVGEYATIHVQVNSLYRFACRIQDVGASQYVLLCLMQHLTREYQFKFYLRFRLAYGTIVQQFIKLLPVFDVQAVERTIYGFKQRGLTATVIAAYQYDWLFVLYPQVQIQAQVGLEVCRFDSLYLHGI